MILGRWGMVLRGREWCLVCVALAGAQALGALPSPTAVQGYLDYKKPHPPPRTLLGR